MVGNIKGEVALDHDGAAYRMRFDFNAMADFEQLLGGDANAMEILAKPLNATRMRAMFWAGLRQCHPDMTLELAGEILSTNIDKLDAAIGSAFPDAKPGKMEAG